MFLAHSINEEGHEHILKDHLLAVSEMVQTMGRTELDKRVARLAALLHDAGKYK
jgi:HD superfamily phosphodiesterase